MPHLRRSRLKQSLLGILLVFVTTQALANEASSLLVQYAPIARIEALKGDVYKITLRDIMPYVNYFTERPDRKAGIVSLEKYLALWRGDHPNNFEQNPPNVDINALESHAFSDDKAINIAGVLNKPHYDKENNILTYEFTPLKPLHEKFTNTTVQYLSIFIDDVCLSCW